MKRFVTSSFIILILLTCFSCVNKHQEKSTDNQSLTDFSSINNTTITNATDALNSIPDSVLLFIKGDWNGDGIEEKLTECYFSKKLNRVIISPYFSDTIDDFIDKIGEAIKLDPRVYLVSENNRLDTLIISDGQNKQTWGIDYLRNMGDMDDDGGEELGYVEHIAQMSSLTMYHIASYKNNKWEILFAFPTWSWAISDTLVKKVGDFKYEITYRGREAFEEKMILDFKKTPRPESLPYFIEGTMEN